MNFSAKPLMLAMVAAVLIFPLGACDTVRGWTSDQMDGEGNSNVTTTSTISDARMDGAAIQPVPHFPPPNDRDLKIMTSKLSGGSVEIYDLDTGAPQTTGAPVAPVMPDYVGIPMATDPNVTIYPIDGYSDYPGELRPVPQSISSAPREWPNAILPVGKTYGSGMTPPPDSFGGDQRMGIEGGKLVSRSGSDISNIYFPYGSARLDGNDRSVLTNVAETAKFAPVDRVSVEGHASPLAQTNDPVKAKILNLKESTNRAVAVSQELIQKGVPAEKIKTVAWGDTKPSGGGEAEQRRVDIYTAGP